MEFDTNAWMTLYDKDFHKDNYLYHFTSLEKAIYIIEGNSLKFSKISTTNDTMEAKPKMSYFEIKSNPCLTNIFNKIDSINQSFIQLLCFTKDSNEDKIDKNYRICLDDYTERGFALPRMWAQYAKNNNGACFVFNKKKLIKKAEENLNEKLIHNEDVSYVSQYTKLDFNYKKLNFLLEEKDELESAKKYVYFLKSNTKYTRYNYFYKLNDWSNEREYRILAFENKELYIQGINDAIVGIIIGEKIKSSDEKIIKYFCKDLCEIKKVSFSYDGCFLKNIYCD